MLSAFKNFLITFVIASVLFGVVAYFATNLLENTMDDIMKGDDDLSGILNGDPPKVTTGTPDTTSPSDGTVTPPTNVPDGASFNLLLVITDYQPDRYSDYMPNSAYLESIMSGYDSGTTQYLKDYRKITAGSVVLLRADKERQEFVLTPVSSLLEVNTPADTMRLGETYGYYSELEDPTGISFLMNKVTYLTGLPIDYYITINMTELSDVLLSVGAIDCELPCNIYYDGSSYFTVLPTSETDPTPEGTLPEGVNLVLSAGKQTLTSESVLPLFQLSERYEDDVWNKQTILYRLTNAYMREISDLPETRITDLFNNLMASSLLKTNLTGESVAKEADLVKMYYEYTVKQLNYPTKLQDAAGTALTFTLPDHENALSQFRVYR